MKPLLIFSTKKTSASNKNRVNLRRNLRNRTKEAHKFRPLPRSSLTSNPRLPCSSSKVLTTKLLVSFFSVNSWRYKPNCSQSCLTSSLLSARSLATLESHPRKLNSHPKIDLYTRDNKNSNCYHQPNQPTITKKEENSHLITRPAAKSQSCRLLMSRATKPAGKITIQSPRIS